MAHRAPHGAAATAGPSAAESGRTDRGARTERRGTHGRPDGRPPDRAGGGGRLLPAGVLAGRRRGDRAPALPAEADGTGRSRAVAGILDGDEGAEASDGPARRRIAERAAHDRLGRYDRPAPELPVPGAVSAGGALW